MASFKKMNKNDRKHIELAFYKALIARSLTGFIPQDSNRTSQWMVSKLTATLSSSGSQLPHYKIRILDKISF